MSFSGEELEAKTQASWQEFVEEMGRRKLEAFSAPEYNEPDFPTLSERSGYALGTDKNISRPNNAEVPLADIDVTRKMRLSRHSASSEIMAIYRAEIPWICRFLQRHYHPGEKRGLLSRIARRLDQEAYILFVLNPSYAARAKERRAEFRKWEQIAATERLGEIRAMRSRFLFDEYDE